MYRIPTDVNRPKGTFYNSTNYSANRYYKNKPYHFATSYNNYKNKKMYV